MSNEHGPARKTKIEPGRATVRGWGSPKRGPTPPRAAARRAPVRILA